MFLLSPFDSESTITSPKYNSGIQCFKAQNYSHIIFLSPGTTTIPHEFHIKTGMEYRKRLQMLWLIVLVFTFFLHFYPPLLPSAFSQTACVSLYRRSLLACTLPRTITARCSAAQKTVSSCTQQNDLIAITHLGISICLFLPQKLIVSSIRVRTPLDWS